ncbi:MAG TPA: Fur family transcriptional regulator [Euzebyales bacterium]|nr:Fur family transcriptional regulator [Euzebyales bacterium]
MTESTEAFVGDADAIEVRRRLRRAGMRVTAPRVAIMTMLLQHPGHHTVGRVADLARQRLGTMSTQAAYNVLAALDEAGLAQRIELPGEPARFEARTGDNHHHMVCRRCGRVEDVDCELGVAPCIEPSESQGFEVDEAEITFWGVCPACREPDEPPASEH